MIQFGERRDCVHAHRHPVLDRVLHVVHADWHGIRSATAACPGLKLTIPHDEDLSGDAMRHIHGLLVKFGVGKIIFQGYSDVADGIATDIKKTFGDEIDLYVVTHVNASQFEHHFEMRMQERILRNFHLGVFRRLGSVKPDFHMVIPEYWPRTIINYAPNLGDSVRAMQFDASAVLIPLENTWRKNLYTNILAAIRTASVELVYTVNWPTELERITSLVKVKLVGYRRGIDLYTTMGSVSTVLAATLAECQPMTQLEAFAVGTPGLTGKLGVAELANHELTRLCEVEALDNPAPIAAALERLVTLRRDDPHAISQMLDDYLPRRHAIADQRYLEFLGL